MLLMCQSYLGALGVSGAWWVMQQTARVRARTAPSRNAELEDIGGVLGIVSDSGHSHVPYNSCCGRTLSQDLERTFAEKGL